MQTWSETELGLKTVHINLLIATLLIAITGVTGCSRSEVVQGESGGAYMNAADLRRMEHFATLPNQWNIAVGPIVAAHVDPEVGVEEMLIVFEENMNIVRQIAVEMTNTINKFENAEARQLYLPLALNYKAKWDALLALNKGYESRDAAAIETAEGELGDAASSALDLACDLHQGLEQYVSGPDLADLQAQTAQIC